MQRDWTRAAQLAVAAAVVLAWCVGMFGRGYWTPDEPREADLAWRMSWQPDKAVPLLAGEAYCEKPPLTYWLAAVPIRLMGTRAVIARLPNLLYALITAIAIGLLAARSLGRIGGWVAAAAISTFLLSYQVAIWLATDAPLLAAVSVALLGAYSGFYATGTSARVRGYLLMHAALALGFLCKSAAAWMVPALALLSLSIWERRWRELLRWELYAGLLLQGAVILTWVWFVYRGDNGLEHLKVFFWNNLVGRFTAVDAPPELQYAAAHRNTPGKYLVELPVYLFPWTLLVIAAARQAWRRRGSSSLDNRALRFAIAASVPSLLLLSVAATARNIYLAPALPGVALLLAQWAADIARVPGVWDIRALRATAALLLLGTALFAAALIVVPLMVPAAASFLYIAVSLIGLSAAVFLSMRAWVWARERPPVYALWALLLAYCALLTAPASQIYRQVDRWQDLAQIGRAVERDAAGKPLILLAPDETTRAVIDMYARTTAQVIPGPLDAAGARRIESVGRSAPASLFLLYWPAQVKFHAPWRATAPPDPLPPWLPATNLRMRAQYSLPNGRRYALLEVTP